MWDDIQNNYIDDLNVCLHRFTMNEQVFDYKVQSI